MYSYFIAGIAPFGQMPLLEVDGKMLAQSMAIARFVANEVGMSRMLILNRSHYTRATFPWQEFWQLGLDRLQMMNKISVNSYASLVQKVERHVLSKRCGHLKEKLATVFLHSRIYMYTCSSYKNRLKISRKTCSSTTNALRGHTMHSEQNSKLWHNLDGEKLPNVSAPKRLSFSTAKTVFESQRPVPVVKLCEWILT